MSGHSKRMLLAILSVVVGGVICCAQSKCPISPNPVDSGQPVPTVNSAPVNDSLIKGNVSLPPGISGTVQVCVNGQTTGDGKAVPVDEGNSYVVKTSSPLKADDAITVQFIPSGGGNPGPPAQATKVSAPGAKMPAAPVISSKFVAGTTLLHGHGQAVDPTQFPSPSKIYICVWPAAPAAGVSLDCRTKPAPLVGTTQKDSAGNTYAPAANDGTFTAQLNTPLAAGQYVSAVEDAGTTQVALSGSPIGVPPTKQCNKNFAADPYPDDDCDTSLSLIGGVEESAQSSSQSATTPFVRVFTRAAPWDSKPAYLWAQVRLLGAPTTSSTNGVVSVVSNPSGSLSTQTFSTVGTSIDFMIGGEYRIWQISNSGYSVSFIFGYGGTTPLQANSLALAYTAPALGTVECPDLYSRFQSQFMNDGIILGTTANTTGTSPSCLVNKNSPTTTNGATTYAPITTIGFSNQDRTSFLGKDVVGIRTIDRFLGSGNKACGDTDTVNHVGPCERGVVDFTFGQDASITGGAMSSYIFKVDAVHPLVVQSLSVLYLFGSASIRLSRNTNYAPLILQSASISSLTGTGTSSVPNPSTVVLSLVQPNRDYYRFGVGINISQIFTKLYAAAQANSGGSGN